MLMQPGTHTVFSGVPVTGCRSSSAPELSSPKYWASTPERDVLYAASSNVQPAHTGTGEDFLYRYHYSWWQTGGQTGRGMFPLTASPQTQTACNIAKTQSIYPMVARCICGFRRSLDAGKRVLTHPGAAA